MEIMGNLTLEEIDQRIARTAVEAAIEIGYYLKQIRDRGLYKEAGCKDVYEYAKKQYGYDRSTTHRNMSRNDRFSVGGNSTELSEEFRGYGKSQLQEMVSMTDGQLEKVKPGMTVKEMKAIKKKNPEPVPDQEVGDYPGVRPEESVATSQQQATESNLIQTTCPPGIPECIRQEWGTSPQQQPLSVYGLPVRTYPPDSLLTTPGCGTLETGGVHDCFSCHMDGCRIRQKECYCVEAPMGNPFPCTTLNVVECLREDVGDGCQFVNHGLAFHRAGDGEPVPCCKNCGNPCGYECSRSANQRSDQETAVEEKPESEIVDADFREVEACCESAARNLLTMPKSVLEEEKKKLNEYLEAFKDEKPEDIPPIVEKQKIIVAALAGMVCDLESAVPEPEQPDLPVMKNNGQRREWLRNYKDWGLWYEDTHIGARYYKYEFENGATLIAEEYDCANPYAGEYTTSYLHLVGGPEPPKHTSYGIGKWQRNERYNRYPNSETELVEFLKEVQKGGK